MLDNNRDDQFSSDMDALDILDSGFYEQGGEYEDPEDIEDIDSAFDEMDDADDEDEA
ncbi:MAG: hypothetical protein IT368_07845 [Candidatus Hydrogenedentes bacterium]|nr:hypothetical protein [Candidatus Hydrogenedentota bacterium]